MEEQGLKALENKELQRTFGQKWDYIKRGLRTLLNGEIRKLHPSSHIIRIIKSRQKELAGHVIRMREKEFYNFLMRKPEGK
jgi:hypothetical protein